MPMSLMPMSNSGSPAPSPRPGTAANLPEDARSWLKAAAGPGRGRLHRAAACQALETGVMVGQWAGLAWVAQDVRARRAGPAWAAAPRPAAVIVLAASLIVPANRRLAGRFAAEGAAERVTASTRLSAVVLDSFRGMRTLAAIAAVARRRGDLAAAAGELNTTTMGVVRRALLSGAGMDVVITFAIAGDAPHIGLSLPGYVPLGPPPHIPLFSGLLALLLCP